MTATTSRVTTKPPSSTPPGLAGSRRPARSWGLVVLATLLVVASALGVVAWGLSAGQRVSVVSVASPVAKGQVIQRADLSTISAAGVDGAIPATELPALVGRIAAVDLVPGQVVLDAMVTDETIPADGESTVGLALSPERVPGAGLAPGDVVDVLATAATDGPEASNRDLADPEILAVGAFVYDVRGEAVDGGLVLVTLVMPTQEATVVASYMASSRVAIVETGTGK